jgi:hypothetical protein
MKNLKQKPAGSATEHEHQSGPLFGMGQIAATPGALELMEKHGVDPATLLSRHVNGDWGDLCKSDRMANDVALQDGSRIFSAYVMGSDKFWIITEAVGADGVTRASTCILLPSEY